jgi:hypothetical protein
MQAAAHTKGGFGGVPQKVGKEFIKPKKMADGGMASLGGMTSSTPSTPGQQIGTPSPQVGFAQGGNRSDLPPTPTAPMTRDGSPADAIGFKKGGHASKKMNDGGKVNLSGVSKVDPLSRRVGANDVYKFPREGQTNFRNIPAGNHPESSNAKRPETIASMEKQRAQRPEMIKKFIKEDVGNHRAPVLPKASGGHITTRRVSTGSTSKKSPCW